MVYRHRDRDGLVAWESVSETTLDCSVSVALWSLRAWWNGALLARHVVGRLLLLLSLGRRALYSAHSVLEFDSDPLRVFVTVRTNPRNVLLLSVALPRLAVLQQPPYPEPSCTLGGPSTSPCSAPGSFGTGSTPSCSTTKDSSVSPSCCCSVVGKRPLAEILTARHSIISKQCLFIHSFFFDTVKQGHKEVSTARDRKTQEKIN